MTSEPTAFTLSYHVERREIWNWYWFYWSRIDGLWRYWVLWLFSLIISAWAISLAMRSAFIDAAGPALLIYFLGIAFFVIFPQLAYKPSVRSITISTDGINTSRAGITARRSWGDISSITVRDGYTALVVAGGIQFWPFPVWLRSRTGNAFIIPDRAFADDAGRDTFRRTIQSWHAIQKQRFPRLASSRYCE
jgi:hypothetical protein